jgi:hypothetical protein
MQTVPQGLEVSSAGLRATLLARQLGTAVGQDYQAAQTFVTRGGTIGGPHLLAGLIAASVLLAYHFKRLL